MSDFANLTNVRDTLTLANGVEIPCVGYGTWQTPNGGVTRDCVKAALGAGYRHIDTAYIYGNEAEVGEGLRASGVRREDVFVTTKHWVTERGYEKTLAAVDTSLRLLGLDYVDLYLVHWPCVAKCTERWKELNAETWRGFEAAYKAGKLRAVGVSNYEAKHIEALWETAEVKPMVNQLEFHPGYTQIENVKWMQQNGLLVEAWSPLGSGAVLKNETLAAVAAKYNKTVAQLCVRFALQMKVLPLPKSTNPARIAANADVFDFEISPEDMAAVAALPQTGFSGFSPEDAPADAIA
ncbi:MAG: aldo/keto reductase [Clostridia bacterium]|nr:aldo/keto reductase [Clostridia bacterium]